LAGGQEAVQFSVVANSLTGDVYCCDAVRVDGKLINAGQAVASVAISECDVAFQKCVELGSSDKDGRFSFVSKRPGAMHYLKLVHAGFNQDLVVVTLRRKGKGLHLKLYIAA
jgi:hypothetical protein